MQVGSASYGNPSAAPDILDGITQFMEKEGIKSLGEIIGAAKQ